MYQISDLTMVGVIIGIAGLILAILAYPSLIGWFIKNKKVIGIGICSFIIGILLGAIFMGANNYPTYEEIVGEANFVFGESSNCSDSDCALTFYDRGLKKGWDVYYCTFDCEHVGVRTFNAVRDDEKKLVWVDASLKEMEKVDKSSTKNNEIRDYYNSVIEKAYNNLNKTVGTTKIQMLGKCDASSETKRFGRIPLDPEFIGLPRV